MTTKQRVHAALEGRPVDRMPVAALYCHLYHEDHFGELTGRPQWELHRWLHEEPEGYVRTLQAILQQAPFEIVQPHGASSREVRERTAFFERDGEAFGRDKVTGDTWPLRTRSGHARDYTANETATVRDLADVREQVRPVRAEHIIASGSGDYVREAVSALGQDHFILSGGVVGTLWDCHFYLGLTNLLAAMVQQPELVDYLSARLVERTIEHIRALAAAGGDAIYIDDAIATNDMISPAHYERFCWPYVRQMVREVQRLGHKAILIYFGGVADRLEQIAALGADGLLVEASMKGCVNDIGAICSAIGDRVTLFGNIDPVRALQDGTDSELEIEVRRQIAAGRTARGFVVSPASPITPSTPLSRVRRFIELGREWGEY